MEEAPGQKRKRKGAAKLQDFHQWYLAAYADHADSRRPRRKGPSFADMEVLYWTHVKEQLETLRKLQRREVAEQWLPRAEEGLWSAEEDHLEDSLEDLGAADDFLEPEEYVEPEGADPREAADLDTVPVSLSYEELVRRNVELFIATSQKFVQETELSQRIRDWEDTVQPLLQEQEQHVPFDIHTYGDQVVSLDSPSSMSGVPLRSWWLASQPSRCVVPCWPPCSWPMTTQWRSPSSLGWRRPWTPCP